MEAEMLGTIEEEFELNIRRIRFEAEKCRRYMNRKYTLMDEQDIEQEGLIVFFKLYRKFMDENKTDGIFFRKSNVLI